VAFLYEPWLLFDEVYASLNVACIRPPSRFEYDEIIAAICGPWVEDLRLGSFRPHEEHLPTEIDFDGVIVTGSCEHVYDRQDWVGMTEMFLRNALMEDIPVLGVCYGHQILASALGGTIERMDETEEGFRTVQLTEAGKESVLFDDMDDAFVSSASHADTVAEMPDDAVVLAKNDYGVQAFHSELFDAYGVQFHPEHDMMMAKELARDNEDEAKVEDILSTITEENYEGVVQSRLAYRNFLTRIVD
jgi:GMP synthase (glutamine-hydrolysing)